MVRINPKIVVDIVQREITRWARCSGLEFSTEVSASDEQFASIITEMITSKYENQDCVEYSLAFDENFESDEDQEDDSDIETLRTRSSSFTKKCSVQDNYDSDSDFEPSPSKRSRDGNKLTSQQKKDLVEFAWLPNGKKRKFTSIHHRYRYAKSWRQIYKFKDQLIKGGDREHLLKDIKLETFNKFKSAFEKSFNRNSVLLIAVAGHKGQDWMTEGSGHEATLVVWKLPNGCFKARQFDPNETKIATIMINSVDIVKKMKTDSHKIAILTGKHKVGMSDCFAYNWEFISKALDGKTDVKRKKTIWLYNTVSRKYEFT
ncbi:hypothetical protein HDE_00644 [Halotydeus destructor]|nr:hypothetical protein HDE_00644 [Halotydeus destructor]